MPTYKVKRPTMEDAHNSQKGLSAPFGPCQQFTPKEREAQIEDAKRALLDRCKRALPRVRNLHLLILSGHVVVEHALDTYIDLVSVAAPREKLKLKFADKVDLAYALGLGLGDDTLIPSIDRLNRLRNDFAHELKVNLQQLDELIRVNSDDYHEKDSYTDIERLKRLRSIIWYICGAIGGQASAQALYRDVLPHYEKEVNAKRNA